MPELKKMPTKEELNRGVENGDCMMVLDYPDFQIVAEYVSAVYYYIDANGEVCAVDAIASLVYDVNHIVKADDASLDLLFDADVCGKRVNDDSIIYMWFKKR